MYEILYLLLIFGAPLASFVWFIVSLIRLLIAPKGSAERKSRRRVFVLSAITYGIFIAIFASLAIWLAIGLMYM